MKFSEIIRNAALNPADFPKSSAITIQLYDGKERLVEDECITYAKPLFAENEEALKNFKAFLNGFEKEPIKEMKVRICIDAVVLFFRTPRALVFLRRPPIDPLDYAE